MGALVLGEALNFLSFLPVASSSFDATFDSVGVWQGVPMDFLKFQPGPLWCILYTLRAGHPRNGLLAVTEVACPRAGGRPMVDFYHFGHPTPYAYVRRD
jgi:hypothetical protein